MKQDHHTPPGEGALADQGHPAKPHSAPPNIRKSIVTVLEHTYGPWLMVLIFSIVLNLDPSVEVLISFLLDWQNQGSIERSKTLSVWAAWIALVLLPLTAAAASQITLRLCKIEQPTARYLRAGLPIICLLGYAFAFANVVFSPEVEALRKLSNTQLHLSIGWVALLWGLIAFVVGAIYAAFFFGSKLVWTMVDTINTTTEQELLAPLEQVPFLHKIAKVVLLINPLAKIRSDLIRGLSIIVVILIGVVGLAAYVGFWDPALATSVGPVGLSANFFTIAIIVLSAMTVLSSRMPGNTPIILLAVLLSVAVGSILAAVVVTFAFFIALFVAASPASKTPHSRMILGTVVFGGLGVLSFIYMYGFFQVPHCKTLAGCNMVAGVQPQHPVLAGLPPARDTGPIRVIAAQGGGLYAAYHTAYYLAHRADEEPGFADSVYAISGVSGGSVGAGVYWAVRASGLCKAPMEGDATNTCHRDAVSEILENDYLTPSLATLLFRDLFDTFVPISALWNRLGFGPIDRGHVLEQELKSQMQAWFQGRTEGQEPPKTAQAPSDLLEISMPDSAYVGPDPSVPATHPLLFFNSTQVDNGAKIVLSPIRAVNKAPMALETAADTHLTVLNSMVISARFPLVTPPARVAIDPVDAENHPHNTVQLVDGGYFDNSGIETAMDIILDLHKSGTYAGRAIELISFRADGPTQHAEIKGTLGAPLGAFLAAWRARSAHSETRVNEVLGGKATHCVAALNTSVINFTLSWSLSQATFNDVKTQITDNAVCAPRAQGG
ncbi:patatin-like phospholipase family protein [uncultured Tateyamaria sp.]|uniref:patatin-like phospholipase family protein n=1 Tax=uncultured Tateyamaria sp. TaxID=455651 RepID=UPI0026320ADB|nr:patatin-like phospholipase family protein [uncultured Tateyamaria sp.]